MSSALTNIQPHEKSINYLNAQKIEQQHINPQHVSVNDHVSLGYKYYHTLSNNTTGSVNTISVPPSLHLLKYVVLSFKVQGAGNNSPIVKDGFNLLARDKAIEIVIPGVSSNLSWSRNALRLYNMNHLNTKSKRDLQSKYAGSSITCSQDREYSFNIMIPLTCHGLPFPRYLLNDMKILSYFSSNKNMYATNPTSPLIISSKMVFFYNTITHDSIVRAKTEPYTFIICEPVTRQYAYTSSTGQMVPIVLTGLYQNNELMKILTATMDTDSWNQDSYRGVDVDNMLMKVGSDIIFEYHEGAGKLRELFELNKDENNFALSGADRFYFSIDTSLNKTEDPKEIYHGMKMGTDPIIELKDYDNAIAKTLDVHAFYNYVLEIHNGSAKILK